MTNLLHCPMCQLDAHEGLDCGQATLKKAQDLQDQARRMRAEVDIAGLVEQATGAPIGICLYAGRHTPNAAEATILVQAAQQDNDLGLNSVFSAIQGIVQYREHVKARSLIVPHLHDCGAVLFATDAAGPYWLTIPTPLDVARGQSRTLCAACHNPLNAQTVTRCPGALSGGTPNAT